MGATASLAFDYFHYNPGLFENPSFNLYELFPIFLNAELVLALTVFFSDASQQHPSFDFFHFSFSVSFCFLKFVR